MTAATSEEQSGIQLIASADDPASAFCSGCGERVTDERASDHTWCVRAWNRAMQTAKAEADVVRADLSKKANKVYELEDDLITANEKLVRAERELEIARLHEGPPTDEKLEGIRQHAFDALQRFFSALADFRDDIEKGRNYSLPTSAQALVDATDGSLMFLDASMREALEDVGHAIGALHELERLGWFRERYGKARIEAVVTFIALDVLRRTIGLKPKKGDD